MYVNNRPIVAIYRLVLGALAVAVLWAQFGAYGAAVWRLFSTWVLVLMAVYFLISAIVTAFFTRRGSGQVICPTWQGAIVVAGLVMLAGNIVIYAHDFIVVDAPGGLWGLVAYFLLPVLALVDWLIFSDKGRWRWSAPFYFLALPTFYAMWILLTAVSMREGAVLRYPYGFLDYNVIGVEMLLLWLLVLGVIILTVGYGLVVLDFVMSGELSKHIVLLRIKTVVVEEPAEEKPVAKGDKTIEKVVQKDTTKQAPASTAKPKTPVAVPPLVTKTNKGETKTKATNNTSTKNKSAAGGNATKPTDGVVAKTANNPQTKLNKKPNNGKKIAISDAPEGVQDAKSAKKLHTVNTKRTKSAQAMHSAKGVGAETGVKKAPEPATPKTEKTNAGKPAQPKDKVAEIVEAAVEKAVEELAKNAAGPEVNTPDAKAKTPRAKDPT